MMTHRLIGRRTGMATATLLAAAVVVSAIARPTAGESPAGTRMTHISVEHRDGDSTVIRVSFDGPIAGHRWSHIDGENPRALLKVAGIVEAYRPYEVTVDDGRVHRIRIGHHPEVDPPEEHLVFDLVDDRVAITRVTRQERRLIVILQRAETSGRSRPRFPSTPTPVVVAPTIVPATPAPTAIPLATATPTPTASSVATKTATMVPPTPSHSASPPTPTIPQQVAASDRPIASDSPPPEEFSGPLLTELVITHRVDGSAVVRVTADRRIEGSDLRFFRVRAAPPRNLLVIPGAGLPGEDALLQIRDGILCEIGVDFTDDGGPARTELTFHLASSEVSFEQAAVKGAHAVILLRPPADPQSPLGCEIESRMESRTWRFTATGSPREAP